MENCGKMFIANLLCVLTSFYSVMVFVQKNVSVVPCLAILLFAPGVACLRVFVWFEMEVNKDFFVFAIQVIAVYFG